MTNPVKKAPPGGATARPVFVFKGFVRCELVKEQKAMFEAWSASLSADDLLGQLSALLDDGFKLSWGEGKQGMTASLSNVDGPAESRGYLLSAMAGRAEKALRVLLYKHLVVLEGQWPLDDGDDDSFFR